MQPELPDERKRVSKHARQMWAATAAVAALVVLVDQLTKNWAVSALEDKDITVVGGFKLSLLFNPGIAFGIGQNVAPVLITVAIAGVLFVMVKRGTQLSSTAIVAMGLVLGGALGNVADRVFRDHGGAVVDFIKMWRWPTYNVADAAVVVGAIILLIVTGRSGEAK